jgi:hypothetical protein
MDIVLKDWKINNIINPSIYFLAIAGVILFFSPVGWWPSNYHAQYYSLTFVVSALLIIFSKYLFKSDNRCRNESAILLQSALSIAFVLNAWGELYFYQLYKYGIPYDKIIHFANAGLFVIVLTVFMETWNKYTLQKALKSALVMVLAGSFLWEFYEFMTDLLFKTSEFGIYGQYKVSDTIFDIASDILGMIFSYYILINPRLSKKIINEYCHWPIFTIKE